MAYALGVDLGTTYTAAAVWSDGQARMFTLGNHGFAVPSAVYVQGSGGFAFGEAAVQRGRLDPDGLAIEFKRRIGDLEPLRLHGRPFAPEHLSARLLAWVLEQVSTQEGGPADSIVVTHPANWHDVQIDKLDEIVGLAGARNYGRVSEPEAAALFYASQTRVPTGSLLAVYDLGGGTFDASVLHKLEDRFEMVGEPEGIERLGGIDFDDIVVGFVQQSLPPELLADLDVEDPRTVRDLTRLRADCTAAKEALSNDAEAVVPVNLGDVRTEVRITRREFEDAIEPFVEETVDTLERAIRQSGVGVSDLTSILLVGGSSRIPLISRVLSATFDRPIAIDTHPKNATALGAAMFTAVATPTNVDPGGARLRPGETLAEVPAPASTRFSQAVSPTVVRTGGSGMRRMDASPGGQPSPAVSPAQPTRTLPAAAARLTDRPSSPRPSLAPAPSTASPPPPTAAPKAAQGAGPPIGSPSTAATPIDVAPPGTADADGPTSGAGARRLPLDIPPPDTTAGFSSPIAPDARWGRSTSVAGRGMRLGADGRLYSEEHAAANAERARQAEQAAARATQLAARRLQWVLAVAVVAAVLVVVVALAVVA